MKVSKALCLMIFLFVSIASAGTLESNIKKPVKRTVIIKLPLQHVRFQWIFTDSKALFQSRLIFSINHKEYPIIQKGRLSSNWLDLGVQHGSVTGIYYEFKSKQPILTSPSDRLGLDWQVKQKIKGIANCIVGYVPKGSYHAKSHFSLLTDHPDLKNTLYYTIIKSSHISEVQKHKLLKSMQYKAYAQSWAPTWPVVVLEKKGWLMGQAHKKYCSSLTKQQKQSNN